MKIVTIKGGLGNQMFCYAFALSLQERYKNDVVKLDVSSFKNDPFNRNYELENVFGSILPLATPQELRKLTWYSSSPFIKRLLRKLFGNKKTEYIEPKLFTYWGDQAFSIPGNCFYWGSWQNEKYFRDYQSVVRKALQFKKELGEKNSRLLQEIKNTQSVSIHVRRDDYIKIPTYQGICELPYYQKAISFIKEHVENPHFYIFSTDTQWCVDNLKALIPEGRFTMVNWNSADDSYKDMQLMAQCKHNIIAHSSFSWWSAWLNQNPNKIVVCPKKWVNMDNIDETPQLDEWIKID